jgi:hypothetical protein
MYGPLNDPHFVSFVLVCAALIPLISERWVRKTAMPVEI